MNGTIHTSPVTVSLTALSSQAKAPIPDSTLLEAFGPSSLGILIVSDLPPHFPSLRARVLRNISRLAHLPPKDLDELTNGKAKYLVGWSHGKETLRPGVVDTMKGSYYVNCAFDSSDPRLEKMRQDWQGFEEYTAPNVWPDQQKNPDMEGFQKDVEELVNLIVDVAGLVARAVDTFAETHVENYPDNGYLEGVVRRSLTSKARLLHYFPSDPLSSSSTSNKSGQTGSVPGKIDFDSQEEKDSWCTTHKDHSCLTGLTSAAFYDESESESNSESKEGSTKKYTELPKSPSPTAGLYILDRTSAVHKVSIPKDSLAFQTGEALEVITKGHLKAVPHFVRGVDGDEIDGVGRKIARNTLAVFTQPNLDDLVNLDEGITFGEFARGIVSKNTTG
jgi:hypothetical protein